jgi:hypothetical protein
MADMNGYGLPDDQKPDARIIGGTGNIFGVMGTAAKTLKRAGFRDEATEMAQRVMACGSYDEALAIVMRYVNPVSE